MAYSPTSLLCGTTISCVAVRSWISLKSSVGSFGNYLSKFIKLTLPIQKKERRTRLILAGVWPAGPALRRIALRRTVPVNGTRIILVAARVIRKRGV